MKRIKSVIMNDDEWKKGIFRKSSRRCASSKRKMSVLEPLSGKCLEVVFACYAEAYVIKC